MSSALALLRAGHGLSDESRAQGKRSTLASGEKVGNDRRLDNPPSAQARTSSISAMHDSAMQLTVISRPGPDHASRAIPSWRRPRG